MENFAIKIDVQKMQGVFLRNMTSAKTGVTKRIVCIPVDDNPNIYVGEKGIYLNLTANQNRDGQPSQYGDTHYVKADVPKEVYEKMTDEQKQQLAILGNMRPITPRQQQAQGTTNSDAPEGEPEEDLPF
jgi:hypothetical protein